MVTEQRAAAERQIHEMNPIGMNDRKRPSAFFGVRTRVRRVMAKLKEMPGFTERASFEMGAIPLLRVDVSELCCTTNAIKVDLLE